MDPKKFYVDHKFRVIASAAVFILLLGMVVFHYVEGWSYLDALYYSLITLTTVGYGDFTPQTGLGKVLSMVYIIFGIGIILAFIDAVMNRAKKRLAKREERRQK